MYRVYSREDVLVGEGLYGLENDSVSVIMSSWQKDMGVSMVLGNNINNGSHLTPQTNWGEPWLWGSNLLASCLGSILWPPPPSSASEPMAWSSSGLFSQDLPSARPYRTRGGPSRNFKGERLS